MSSPAAGVMAPRFMRIEQVKRETEDTFTLSLDGGDGFHFQPGQFNMLYLPGIGEVPISISGDPASPARLIHTIRKVGSVTAPMGQLKPGDQLGVRGPFGRPWPIRNTKGDDIVVVAGGIGLAPLRPVALEVLANRGEYGKVTLLYGARTPEDILFHRELDMWRAGRKMDVRITVDAATRMWKGNVGLVTMLIAKAAFDPARASAFVCGPEVMMRFVAAELARLGVGPDRIYVSLERNMHCGAGVCGRCQQGPKFVCKDGPVFPMSQVRQIMSVREI